VADYAKDVLVDTQWLEDHLDDDSIRIVEVDENPRSTPRRTSQARSASTEKDLQDQVERDFLGPDAFGELFGSNGISNDHLIVLYGDRNNWFAAYTYWYLSTTGTTTSSCSNGPREKWIGEGRATTADVPSTRRDLQRPAGRRRDSRAPRRGLRGARQADQAGRRSVAAGVLGRAHRNGRL